MRKSLVPLEYVPFCVIVCFLLAILYAHFSKTYFNYSSLNSNIKNWINSHFTLLFYFPLFYISSVAIITIINYLRLQRIGCFLTYNEKIKFNDTSC